MSIVVRPADLEADREILIGVLNENLPRLQHGRRFDWLYLNNPHGTACAWIAQDDKTGEVIGTASVFPRLMRIGGKTLLCGQVGDFAVSVGYRSLGPAVLLQKATLSPIFSGEMDFCYDAPPDELGMSTFKRMQISPMGRMLRFAKPLRADRKIKTFVRPEPVARGVSALGNWLLRVRNGGVRLQKGYEIVPHKVRFGAEFSRLDNSMRHHYSIYSPRSAEYLNWRYLDYPLRRYEILTARHEGKLRAYCVFSIIGDDAYLNDLFGDLVALEELLISLIRVLLKRPIMSLHAMVLGENHIVPVLRRAGFYFRQPSHFIVVSSRPNYKFEQFLGDEDNWYLTYADAVI